MRKHHLWGLPLPETSTEESNVPTASAKTLQSCRAESTELLVLSVADAWKWAISIEPSAQGIPRGCLFQTVHSKNQ